MGQVICKSTLTHRLTPPRFILTARAYIFEEARRASEHLADRRLGVSKHVLDVGKYTRRTRARILYNHLHASRTPQCFSRQQPVSAMALLYPTSGWRLKLCIPSSARPSEGPETPKDFEESLKVLEGGFIAISSELLSFVNLSLRHYLTAYLLDTSILAECAWASQRTSWAERVEEQQLGSH
ncbi:hypothetical protein [Bradyrhizobium sp. BR 10261]|uniref:nSTAND3 domain-containing NTPase n=1 Tax=Bradyrhizobium sp. BR 10261 TaxID=2749992 RepID=UPI001C64756C|nr:hypothetical protein [Bradyrhizobium sp. BR 10261]MBW7966668.1 hypothetical protein [Bradyrhizobium sp. BR 10261]